MTRVPLADTLAALAEGASPLHDQIVVESAEISLPLLVTMEHGPDGPRFFAQPPYSPYRSGVEPVHHRVRLSFGELTPEESAQVAALAAPVPSSIPSSMPSSLPAARATDPGAAGPARPTSADTEGDADPAAQAGPRRAG